MLFLIFFRYPFAITGIDITYSSYILLKTGRVKTHFYNSHFGTTCLNDFHKLYCEPLIYLTFTIKSFFLTQFFLSSWISGYLFFMFDQLWLKEKPEGIMEFRFIRQKFLSNLNQLLDKVDTVLKWTPPIDVI